MLPDAVIFIANVACLVSHVDFRILTIRGLANSKVLCMSKVNGIGDWFILMMKSWSLLSTTIIGQTVCMKRVAMLSDCVGCRWRVLCHTMSKSMMCNRSMDAGILSACHPIS